MARDLRIDFHIMITIRRANEGGCANPGIESFSSWKNSSRLKLGVRKQRVSGFELKRLRADQGQPVPILFITAYKNQDVRKKARRAAASR